mmetsp:Transcript_10216/g.17720  ORF Transcript_10216/g.17720 Transcript_10216/m.17720 type:complete len:289 (+) Transcript_10216:576-1442(+)
MWHAPGRGRSTLRVVDGLLRCRHKERLRGPRKGPLREGDQISLQHMHALQIQTAVRQIGSISSIATVLGLARSRRLRRGTVNIPEGTASSSLTSLDLIIVPFICAGDQSRLHAIRSIDQASRRRGLGGVKHTGCGRRASAASAEPRRRRAAFRRVLGSGGRVMVIVTLCETARGSLGAAPLRLQRAQAAVHLGPHHTRGGRDGRRAHSTATGARRTSTLGAQYCRRRSRSSRRGLAVAAGTTSHWSFRLPTNRARPQLRDTQGLVFLAQLFLFFTLHLEAKQLHFLLL